MSECDVDLQKKKIIMKLDCFQNLVADNEKIRQEAGLAVLRHLSQLKVNDPGSKELEHSLKRLIRGLGSSRTTAKKGFFSTLTAYMKFHQDTDVNSLLQFMETELKTAGSNSKGENADIYMGQILLCGALIRSKVLIKCPVEEQQKIIKIILNAGTQRSYLSFVSTSFLIELINEIDEGSLRTNIWPLLEKELAKGWEEHSLDTFYALLVINAKFPSLVGKKFFMENLGSKKIIDSTSMDKLVKLVTDIPRVISCQHPLYKIFCEKLASSEHLTQFWNAIDQRFTKPSKNMEHLAVEMLNLIITNIKNKDLIPSLLSPNFLQHMLKRFNSSKRNRRDDVALAFRQFLSHLVSLLNDKELKPKIQIAVLKKLILHPGDLMIEKITGTKTIQMITHNMCVEGIKKLSKFYAEIVKNSKPKQINDKEESWTNAERTYAGQLLSKLLGHTAMSSEHAWRLEQLKLLFNLGLCESASVSVELAPQFRESFYRALDHKLPKLTDLRNILSELIAHFNKELFTSKTQTLRVPFTEEAMEIWNTMMTFIENLDTDCANNKAPLIFYIMDVNMALQLFIDAEMAISSIKEIHSCSERLTKAKKKVKKQKMMEEEEPEWVEVIVDLLLSLLSKNNHLLRSLVRCVFPHLCPILTPPSIHQILSVLDPKDDKGPLVPKNSEDSDEETDEESDESDNATDEDNDIDMEDDDDEDEDDDDEEEDETVTDRLRLAVRQALGDASAQTDDEDMDIDELTEEDGKKLDESLASAFRILRESRRSSKQKQSKSAEALTHFRVRVIDLLEIYLESAPSMASVLDMIVPLFALLEFCIKDPHQKPLENRVRTCLRKLALVKKFKDFEGVDETLLTDLARVLIEKGEKSTAICQEMGDKLAECFTFLIRCVQQSGMPSNTLVSMVRDNLTAFFKKRDCVLPASLFKNILQLSWDGNWQLISLLEEYAFDKTIRSFRRGQALEFLTTFYRNHRMVVNDLHLNVRQKLEKKISKHSSALLQELTDNSVVNGDAEPVVNGNTPKAVRQKFVCLLWILLHAIYPNHIVKSWDWKSISDAMAAYRAKNTLSKDAKTAYNKLASQIGAPRNVKSLQKK